MTAKCPLRALGLTVLLATGCARQDAEILSRVGHKLAENAKASSAGLREKFPFRLAAATAEPTLGDIVKQRLATDKLLVGLTIEIQATGADIELKGTVDREEQKRRAVELAESTQGVQNVVDSIQMRTE